MSETPARQVVLQKFYIKDASVEVPSAPLVFTREVNPQVDVNFQTQINALGGDNYQVSLITTATAKEKDEVLFLIEVEQAGIFLIQGFDEQADLQAILAGYCPEVLFPFVRESISYLSTHAGFSPVLLQPVNFNALYQQHLAEQSSTANA
jgi:preprotein translocase subunit SecB